MTTDTRSRPSALGLSALKPYWEQLKEGLVVCIPASVTQLLAQPGARLLLVPEGDAIAAYAEEPEGRRRLGQLSGDPGDRTRLSSGPEQGVVLRLPGEQVLTKELNLPLEAESDLRRVIGYQLPRETPFNAKQVYFDAVVTARDSERKRLRVKLVLSLRNPVDELLGRITASGLQPMAIEAASVPGSNLLPLEQRPRPARSGGRRNAVLALIAGLLLVAAIAVPLVEKRLTITATAQMLAEAQKRSETVVKLRDELDDTEKALAYFSGRQATSAQTLLMLNELAKVLPDGTWVQMIDFNGNQLRVTGESSDAAALIPLVEASPLFADTSFQAPVTRNAATSSEHFLFATRVEGLGGGANQ